MYLFHNIGKSPVPNNPQISENYNSVEEVLSCKDHISFDGIYTNVYNAIMNNKEKFKEFLTEHSIVLFVIGDTIGKDNSFDSGMPRETFCTIEQIMTLKSFGCKLGWHTKSHKDLTTLSDDEQLNELRAPKQFSDYLAYPYGRFNSRTIQLARSLGYREAWSVIQGNDTPFQLNRKYKRS